MLKDILNKILQFTLFFIGLLIIIFPVIVALETDNSSHILWMFFSAPGGFILIDYVDKIEI